MTRIPRYIDDQPTFLFWDVDEIIVICICIIVGMIIGKLTYLLLSGLVLSKGLGKLKQNKSEGYFMHVLYWYGVPMKGVPPSYMRSFVE